MQRDSIQVRDAQRSESSVLSALALEAKAAWGYDTTDLTRWQSDLTLAPDHFERLVIRVATDGDVLGFHALRAAHPRFLLEHLWVRPVRWRSGIGRALIQDALECAHSRGAVGLEIDADPNAEAFYLRMGARRVGSVPAPAIRDPDRVLPRLWLDAIQGPDPATK